MVRFGSVQTGYWYRLAEGDPVFSSHALEHFVRKKHHRKIKFETKLLLKIGYAIETL